MNDAITMSDDAVCHALAAISPATVPLATISPAGEVWLNPDLRFANLDELPTDVLLLTRALLNEAVRRKTEGRR